ncbi:tryptophan-rich sensory protein [Arthrobacter sp. RIT-PI-e]|uniref:tryptophan-rich sensory protein n=1 Tax=Arthrobacter sp. RIT-PI-e TaxID=1681197 RepID=UPI000675BE89|nr:tryptophan-rich sensory protein [Arthrobacter sp. RIT-PI-e]
MSTPNSPGPQLPDTPGAPETGPAPAAASTESASVLERLKAARPRTAATGTATGGDDAPTGPSLGAAAQGKSGTTPARRTPTVRGSGEPAPGAARTTSGSGRQDTATGRKEPADGRAPTWRISPERAAQLRSAARTAGQQTRRAAHGAGVLAGATGRAVRRGSSAAVRNARTWDPDLVRQCVVTLCAVVCILGSAAGAGAFGGPSIRDAAGGLFAPDATLLAPSSTAFSLWRVIYVGLVAYTAYQWLPSQRTRGRQRALGWPVAASMILNLAWILSAQAGLLVLSLVVILLLFFTLLFIMRTLNAIPERPRAESVCVDIPLGLYLGWVLVAAAANAAALLTDRGVDLFDWHGTTWAILGIVAVLITAAVVCSTDRGRLAVAAATSWGLGWIAVERATGEPGAVNVTFVAALAIFLLVITAGSRRHRGDHAYRRSLRAEEDSRRAPLDVRDEDADAPEGDGTLYSPSRY